MCDLPISIGIMKRIFLRKDRIQKLRFMRRTFYLTTALPQCYGSASILFFKELVAASENHLQSHLDECDQKGIDTLMRDDMFDHGY